MRKLFVTAAAICATGVFASSAFAGDDMSGKSMSMKPSASSPANKASDITLTDAEVMKVDVATGMVMLKHGELANISMAAMTMAYKAKDAAMVKQAHEGDQVKVRVEDVGGTMTIVTMVKRSP